MTNAWTSNSYNYASPIWKTNNCVPMQEGNN
jgi:hypothetical protein